MARLFISYSRRDQVFAKRLATSLERLGATIWLDVDDIPAGMNWSSSIQEGLDSAELMLLVISPDSMASANVANEWQYFIDQHKPIVPILWHPAKIHFQLNRLQYVDFQAKNYETALTQLSDELARLGHGLQRVATPSTVTPTGSPPPEKPSSPPRPPGTRSWLWIAAVVVLGLMALIIVPRLNQSQSPGNSVPLSIHHPSPSASIGDEFLCIDGMATAANNQVQVQVWEGDANIIASGIARIDTNHQWMIILEIPAHTASAGSIRAYTTDQGGATAEHISIAVTLTDKYLPEAPVLGKIPDGMCQSSDTRPLHN